MNATLLQTDLQHRPAWGEGSALVTAK